MKSSFIPSKIGLVLLVLCLAALACNGININQAGAMQTETKSVELGTAASAKVQLNMAAGELNLTGGADQLMQATFSYNVPEWQPSVDYTVSGSQGELMVQQGGQDVNVVSNMSNTWDIQLDSQIPLDLEVHSGASAGKLDLSSLDLTSLRVETGVGNTDVNLDGTWQHDVNAAIKGGVGALTVTLPDGIGVRVDHGSGLVSWETSGLAESGGYYVNQAYGDSPYTLFLKVEAGVGSVTLRTP
jgi:hypothetical protein